MPNIINAQGIQTKTQSELISELIADFQAIYGPDINVGPETPDGELLMIFIQSILDTEDLLVQIFNSFDPDSAIGKILDQRVAINGIQRRAATFTVTPITITVDRALTLYGLNQTSQPVYTVKDNSGNEFQLQNTVVFSSAGSQILNFQASKPGEVLTLPNTITLPVTVVLGVTSINNPSTYTTLGINEETDQALKIRRQKSVSLPAQGFLSSLYAALENINGVSNVFIYENTTGGVDADGTDSHTIWVIVSGSATDAEIANAIYLKRNAGAGMRGAQTYVITQADGSPFVVRWDEVLPVNLYIKFDATSLDGINPPNVVAIKNYLVANFKPGVYEKVNINDLATAVQLADNNTLVTNAGFGLSGGGPFTNTLQPNSKEKQFIVSSPNINITVI
jgi:uncharacterized phage protein gp47/JayE